MSELVRVSAAHLALTAENKADGRTVTLGLVNRSSYVKKKQLMLTPPGGALMLLKDAEQRLLALGAVFEKDGEEGGREARFTIPALHLEDALVIVGSRDPRLVELDVSRELIEELATAEIPELKSEPVLSLEDCARLESRYLGSYRQPLPLGADSSSRATDIPSRRLFHLHHLVVPADLFAKLEEAFPYLVLLSDEEVATTDGGRRVGSTTRGSLTFGIGNNVFKVG